MVKIEKITALEILDSRGNPTIEVDVHTDNGIFSAAVPSGASTGKNEAVELRDGGKRYLGKGVTKAIKNVEKKIGPRLVDIDVFRQREVDDIMLEIDNTYNKSKLGANAILGVSLAVSRAGADYYGLELYEYINEMLLRDVDMKMPRAFFNVINGGKHAGNKLEIQEFMISPKSKSFKESLRIASETYHILKDLIKKKYGLNAVNVGDEGGFAPPIARAEDALVLIRKAIVKAGYKGKIDIALDCAASEYYVARGKGYYLLNGRKSEEQLVKYYLKLIKRFGIISIEDPFHEEDFETFCLLRKEIWKDGLSCQVVGDDLTVTNPGRVEQAIIEKSCNCLLLKVNQVGSLTETLEAVRLAYDHNWKVMVSHRSGETEDPYIADLAVGLGCGQIKAGAPCRSERTAKYNQLLRIEQSLRGGRK
ncbi:phosphopyruvate hydratase [archaeon]|jgi:enolase|nr:phosphopyruvate hydratase [archaeon]MBT6869530.1 phosphopyruvate hydratase [archaeon]MBT7193695.1 phosphopyruvate hydratase [archaeon]MBT7380386.1 phosphopyruvate hydratase [archaeon]MBT7508707.1 phosphopyruvate hydratase [archaeon]